MHMEMTQDTLTVSGVNRVRGVEGEVIGPTGVQLLDVCCSSVSELVSY